MIILHLYIGQMISFITKYREYYLMYITIFIRWNILSFEYKEREDNN